MHGPFLFHITALSYFLFGDNDFAARLPVALMGVALVIFPYLFRRWLGRAGALATSFFLLISPSIAYYSRYIRHDIPTTLWSLVVIFAIFSYLRDGRKRWLYLMAAGVSLMFATKEVAFIYAAISGLFLVGLLVFQAVERQWPHENLKQWFLIALATIVVGLLILGLGLILKHRDETQMVLDWWALAGAILTALGLPAATGLLLAGHLQREDLRPSSFVIALAIAVVAVGLLFRLALPLLLPYTSCVQQGLQGQELQACTQSTLREFAWPEGTYILGSYIDVRSVLTCLPFVGGLLVGLAWLAITAFRRYHAFDLVTILGTLCLPLLSPFLIKFANLDPTDYTSSAIYYSGAIAVEVILVSLAIGLIWDMRRQTENKDLFTWLLATG
jgi:4-amino-4-deoxy-L-arabinose transferase-like glycosyltransferase